MRHTLLTLTVTALLATSLSGCVVPVVAGGAAAAGYVGLQDRPAAQIAKDTDIKLSIKKHLADKKFEYVADIGVDVYYNDVLLTGIVPDAAGGEQVLEIARRTEGVKRVYNELFVGAKYSMRQKASDAWVLAQIQPRLLGSENAFPLNYLISVVNGHVYVLGSVSGSEEHRHTLHILRTTRGVKQVHDYLVMNGETDPNKPQAPTTTKFGNLERRETSPFQDSDLR